MKRRKRKAMMRLAAVTAVAYVFGYLTVFAHTLAVQHVTCPEHGETLHLYGNNFTTDQLTEEPDALHAQQSDEVHGDDHCALVALVSGAQLLLRKTAVSFQEPVVPDTTVAIPSQKPRPPPIAVFRLAPKQSPPVGLAS